MTPKIRPALRADTARANAMLAALSDELGDIHRTEDADLEAALFGPEPSAVALVAETEGDPALAGISMFSPQFSTTRGTAGAYVSDLFVAPGWRGSGLGPRLLAATRDVARMRWGARYLSLAAYAETPRALAFYRRLGFAETTGTHHLTLQETMLTALGAWE